jgi:DNA-binding IclR family transcriptional regulator
MSQDAPDDRYTVPALMRGLQLLGQFSRSEPELSGADLSRKLDLPRASVFRMLHTLEQAGFVTRAADGTHYKLGLGVLRLGFEFLASMELTEQGRPIIEALRDRCGYSAHLVVRDGREVVFVGKVPGTSALFHSIQVGARLPAHATVLGRLLMADLDMAALSLLYPEPRLQSYTPKTPTTLKQLKLLIDEDKARGFGVSQGGFETGISTIAAPVFEEHGKVAAAISITVPAQRIEEKELNALVDEVRLAARDLSAHLSHSPSGAVPMPFIQSQRNAA